LRFSCHFVSCNLVFQLAILGDVSLTFSAKSSLLAAALLIIIFPEY